MSVPRTTLRLVLLSLLALLVGSLARAQSGQTTVGVQKFGAYDGFPDTVDVGSLGLNINIPLFGKGGRGSGTGINLALQSFNMQSNGWPQPTVWDPTGQYYYNLNIGPSISFGVVAGEASSAGQTHNCVSQGALTYTDYYWTYTDALGNSHLFPGTSRVANSSNSTCANAGFVTTTLTAQAADGSGYLINVTGSGPATITDPSGHILTTGAYGQASLQDSNGNILSTPWGSLQTDSYGNITTYSIQDTVGSTLYISGGGMSTDYSTRTPLTISYLDDLGNQQTITIAYKLYGSSSQSPTVSTGLMDSIAFPDGSAYHFTYVFSSAGSPLGIATITLPSGGVISYSYPGGINSCGNGYPVWIPSLTRTTSDGTTTYTRNITSTYQINDYCHIASSWTQINKPNGDQTTVYFVVPQHYAVNPSFFNSSGWIPDWGKTMETNRIVYDQSNLSAPIRTTMSCYNGTTGDCTTTAFNEPVTQLAVTTTLDNGLSNQTITTYTGSLPSEVDEYDYGASAPTRKTLTSYASLGNNISDRPASVIVYDAAGNVIKKTTYAYDETTPVSMTLPGHNAVSGSRGNPTSVYQWLVSSNQSFQTQYTYDDAGQVTSVTDANGNVTSYNYDATTDAYRTTITRPTTNSVAHISTFGYGPNSGLVTSAHDENNQLTTYTYDSMFRPSSITYPDGGQTTFSYTVTSKTISSLMQSGVWSTNVEQYDAYGRISQVQLTSDPDCPSGDKTDTTYDALGRVHTVSNPYCSTSDATYGITTYAYDALGRTTQLMHPDGATIANTYTGRATQVGDEGNGTQRVTRINQTDGLGRLVSVCEVSSVPLIGSGGTPAPCGQDIPATGFLTTYQYDSLDNLVEVDQSGIAPRTFVYDSLSQLTSATNPESGTTSYTYDANGNIFTKIDARGITTCFGWWTGTSCSGPGYDALNRLLSKTFSDGTSGVTFVYDSPTNTFVTVNGNTQIQSTNPIGRLTYEYTFWPNAQAAYSYDPMGRINQLWSCQDAYCDRPILWVTYGYDLLGNEIDRNLNGSDYASQYNGAGRLTSVTKTTFTSATNPGNLLSSAKYDPFGHMTSANFANNLTQTWSYNNRGFPFATAVCPQGNCAATTLYAYSLGYAPNGNVLSSADLVNGSWNYSYDDFNRLTCTNSADNGTCASPTNGTPTYSYVYDRFGNRWQQNGPNSFSATFTGNNPTNPANNNQMDGYHYDYTGTLLPNYDAAGNLLYDGLHDYVYDAENRIRFVDGDEYEYDAEGRRMEKRAPGGTVTADYFYNRDGTPLIEIAPPYPLYQEVYADGMHLATYTLNAAQNGTDLYFHHNDWLGTERTRTDYTGTPCETISSLPFGDGQNVTSTCAEGDVSPMHFTGKERDAETGLDYFGLRYDSSSAGRFMSPDPGNATVVNADPQSWNAYAYVRNNPINLTDPTGAVFCRPANDGEKSQGVTRVCDVTDAEYVNSSKQQQAAYDKAGYTHFDCSCDTNADKAAWAERKGNISRDYIGEGLIFLGALAIVRALGGVAGPPPDLRLPQDRKRQNDYPKPPPPNNGNSTIGTNPNQDAELRRDIRQAQQEGAKDIRVNQEQVNAQGVRVGQNKPDLQITDRNDIRHYTEYDQDPADGLAHAQRIRANDPAGVIHLKTIK